MVGHSLNKVSIFQQLGASVCITSSFKWHTAGITHELSLLYHRYLISTWYLPGYSCRQAATYWGKIISMRKSVSLVTWKGHFCCVSVGFIVVGTATSYLWLIDLILVAEKNRCDNSTNILSPGKSSSEESERAKNHIGQILLAVCVHFCKVCIRYSRFIVWQETILKTGTTAFLHRTYHQFIIRDVLITANTWLR